ncbi:MAG: GIY-YIG nuclease family protein [Candidatus Marinimicrobia bacterium]|nr:GIY-YIG nuclease family protein [Candidatus Neomarinimicrobiota bacterium]
MKTGIVYILLCSDETLYTGVTSNLENRLFQHHEGFLIGYTHSRRPLTLLWNSEEMGIQDAILLEKQIKGWGRAKKYAFMAGDVPKLKELSLPFRDKK